jgi:hypothetical protein
MDEEKTAIEMTLDILAEKYPELHNQLVEMAQKEGEKLVRELFNRFVERFGDDTAFVIEHFGKGDSLELAIEVWFEKMKAEYQESKELQDEFGGPEGLKDYIAFRKAEGAGRIS